MSRAQNLDHTEGIWKVYLFYSQNNKIVWLSNMADIFFLEIHEVRKGLWAFVSWLCFPYADWLSRQTRITWLRGKGKWSYLNDVHQLPSPTQSLQTSTTHTLRRSTVHSLDWCTTVEAWRTWSIRKPALKIIQLSQSWTLHQHNVYFGTGRFRFCVKDDGLVIYVENTCSETKL